MAKYSTKKSLRQTHVLTLYLRGTHLLRTHLMENFSNDWEVTVYTRGCPENGPLLSAERWTPGRDIPSDRESKEILAQHKPLSLD